MELVIYYNGMHSDVKNVVSVRLSVCVCIYMPTQFYELDA
jgi:hypothetical protein